MVSYGPRYTTGFGPLRRDERTQTINDQAARNAFVISMLATGAISIYYSNASAGQIPAGILRIILLIGAAGYFRVFQTQPLYIPTRRH